MIFGVLRAHGGKIAEENCLRSPVSGSVRLSLTRGAVTSTAPVVADAGTVSEANQEIEAAGLFVHPGHEDPWVLLARSWRFR